MFTKEYLDKFCGYYLQDYTGSVSGEWYTKITLIRDKWYLPNKTYKIKWRSYKGSSTLTSELIQIMRQLHEHFKGK